MPNYVTNIIKFKNQKAFDLFRKTYIEATEDGGEVFDFNKLIPMPPKLKIESGSLTDDGIDYVIREMLRSGFPGIESIVVDRVEEILRRQRPFGYSRPTDADLDEKVATIKKIGRFDQMVEQGKKAIQNILDYGYQDWYLWSVENWGTKWNAYNYRDDPDELTAVFETAWSTPAPIIHELSENIPNGIESVEFADEDVGRNCGYYDFKYYNGRVQYLVDDSDEALDLAIRVQGDEEFFEKDEAGHWHRIDD